MALRVIAGWIITTFLVFLSLSICSSSRLKGRNNVEDLEIHRQLKILNKPYVKSIEVFVSLNFLFL
jgi:hypothetical protein